MEPMKGSSESGGNSGISANTHTEWITVHVLILGTRGVPSRHSGFETFAQDFALFLHARGHQVTVYCQLPPGEAPREDVWEGIRRIQMPARVGPVGTIEFDWKTIRHAIRQKGAVALTLGYNTGIFNLLFRFTRIRNIMNMDGIEWKRAKWSLPARMWFWANEWAGARVAHHLVADHPEIAKHLERHTAQEKIVVIPYGADLVHDARESLIQEFGLSSNQYDLIIARPEPENSILEIVQGHSMRERDVPLVILGTYTADGTTFQRAVLGAATGRNVRFLGAIFDRDIVKALRFHARAYFHGHRVGGTNPSLVESLAAGNAIIAHNNRFTRWVAGNGALYFSSPRDVDEILTSFAEDAGRLNAMKEASRRRHQEAFTQETILTAYEELLLRFAPDHLGKRALEECEVPVRPKSAEFS
jgi:glycosyltransferase involved in cell wall biosynthesis